MSLVLAFDTATESVGLGLVHVDGDAFEVLVNEAIPARRRANQLLLTLIEERLKQHGLRIGDIDEIVVGRGPGSFTGVRIGVAAAKGLAQGLGVPLYGASTTEAIAAGVAQEMGEGLVGVIGDAMRGEVYPALFEVHAGGVISATPDRVAKPLDVAAEWAAGVHRELILTGNGLAKYQDVFESALGGGVRIALEPSWYPTGMGLLRALRRESGECGAVQVGDPGVVLPVYTRLSDAEENERARLLGTAQRPSDSATKASGLELPLAGEGGAAE